MIATAFLARGNQSPLSTCKATLRIIVVCAAVVSNLKDYQH